MRQACASNVTVQTLLRLYSARQKRPLYPPTGGVFEQTPEQPILVERFLLFEIHWLEYRTHVDPTTEGVFCKNKLVKLVLGDPDL